MTDTEMDTGMYELDPNETAVTSGRDKYNDLEAVAFRE
jgi:hypothetical protein